MRGTTQTLRAITTSPWFRLGALPIWHAIRRLTRPEVRIVTGGVAFYALFSIFPLIYLTLTLLIAVLPSDISTQIAGSIEQILATGVDPLREDEISVISALTPQGLTFRALAAVLIVGFTATSGAKAAITGIRMIAGTVGKSGIIRFQGISLLMTALLILLVWLLGAMQVVLTVVEQGQGGDAGRFAAEIAQVASTLWITKWVASFLVFYLVIALSLRGHVESGRALVLGAIAGSASWLAATWLFQLYLRLSVLDTVYGALASVILGFVWLIASVTSLLLGAALAAEWSKTIKGSPP
ncbi:MAG: YhjD/YihY/BrkB family envelope integrity protein [Pseudomonadota bacterium]